MIKVLSNGAEGSGKSILVNFGSNRVLFNCGESADHLDGVVNGIFVTHLNWRNIGAIVSLIYKMRVANREELMLCGPSGLGKLMATAEKFLNLSNIKVNVTDWNSIPQSKYDITCVPLKNKHPIAFQPDSLDKAWIKVCDKYRKMAKKHTILNKEPEKFVDLNTSYSYIFLGHKSKAWVLSECVKRGVKPGENLEKLWNGQEVTVDDGTVVRPEDVISTVTSSNVIILDCPNEGYLDDLLDKKEYEDFYNCDDGLRLIIVHFTAIEVMKNKKYISWMKRFPIYTKHVIVNDSNEWDTYEKLRARQQVCRLISTRFFPNLRSLNPKSNIELRPQETQDHEALVEETDQDEFVEENPTKTWLQKWSSELQRMNLIQSWYGTMINLENTTPFRRISPLLITNVPGNNKSFSESPAKPSNSNPTITFLGTGAQGNSFHRNTAGILLQLSQEKALVLDCGGGIMDRLSTLYSKDELQTVLTSIQCIFISHTHADHHAGLFGLLRAIQKASIRKNLTRKVVLLFPSPLLEWFEMYHCNFESLFDNVILIDLNNMVKDFSAEERSQVDRLLNRTLGFKSVKTCWAAHSSYSFCISLQHTTGWKISYSGDTKFCQKFIDIGMGSDLLIHEATYATGLGKIANLRRHSTTEDAIQVGAKMNAKHVILTHFSQRYPVVPCLTDLKDTSNVSPAFDFLQVTLKDLHLLPKLNLAYEVAFEEYARRAERVRAQQLRNIDKNLKIYFHQRETS